MKIYALKIVAYVEAENDLEALRQAQHQINDLQEVNTHRVIEIAELLDHRSGDLAMNVRKINLLELSNKLIYNENDKKDE